MGEQRKCREIRGRKLVVMSRNKGNAVKVWERSGEEVGVSENVRRGSMVSRGNDERGIRGSEGKNEKGGNKGKTEKGGKTGGREGEVFDSNMKQT